VLERAEAGCCIVVVHDDDATRELATNALSDAGHEVTAFDNPMQVLDAMDGPTRIRVLVTRVDFGAGTLHGAALARMVRVRQPATKVVFVAREENRLHTVDLGEFLPMPLDPQALADVVGRLPAEPGPAFGGVAFPSDPSRS
jgi:DNA-binding NtrC family response regulator